MVSSYFEPLTRLIYAIGAVVGLIGGVRVYSKFSSGRPRRLENRRRMVRRLHLPRGRGDRPALLLPVRRWANIKSTGASAVRWNFRASPRSTSFSSSEAWRVCSSSSSCSTWSGIPQGACILFAVVAAASVVGITFRLNRRYGPHGLMKRLAARRHPRRIIHRRSIRRLLTTYKP